MGRRAKNKQGDPAPLVPVQENAGRPSQKKLGKRKADDVDSSSKRPAKKAKEDARAAKPATSPTTKGKEKSGPKSAVIAKAAKTKPKHARFEHEDEEAGSDEGWEDVHDDDDLQAQAKYVCFVFTALARLF